MKTSFTMQDARFGALVAFSTVAEERSFTLAARRLGVSPSAVSQAVRRLEAKLGVSLLTRTSRRVRLTDEGSRLLARASPALAELAATLETAATEADMVTGTIRITAGRTAAVVLPPLIRRYLEDNPAARVEVRVDDRLIDLIADGFDAGVRLQESVPADMVTVRVGKAFRFVVVGSPSYLAAHGQPRTLRDLRRHTCVSFRLQTSEKIFRWEFEQRGRVVRVDVPTRLVVNDNLLAIDAAKAGLGLTYIDEPSVAADIARGELSVVLGDLAANVPGWYLYFPEVSRRTPRVRALVRAARAVRDAVAED
jgi:DNA-binding transcriptional LysR family regulator